MNIEKWLDLSGHGLKLSLVKVPSGKTFIALLGEVKKHESTILGLGYRPATNNPNLMTREARFRDNGTLANAPNADEWKKLFPEAKVITFDPDVNVIDRSKVDNKAVPSRPVQAGGRLLGINSLGHEVYEQPDGSRYALDERKATRLEADADASQAGNFLRAPDPASLHRCALGFVEQAERGAILRADDFARFVSVIHPVAAAADPEVVAETRAAVEAAAATQLAKRGGKTIREAFIKSSKLAEKLAFLSDGRGDPLLGPAAPMAMAAQRLLGLNNETAEKRIVIDGVGGGHLLTHLPKGCIVVASDSRPAALAGARSVAAAAGLRSFLATAERPEIREAAALVMDLDGSPADDAAMALFDPTLHINPDLMRIEAALAARAGDGTAVFLLDEPKDEEAKAELERFRNNLSMNYAFDGEARIDPGLAKGRPDASARLMLAVGPRRDEPSDTAFPPSQRPIQDWSTLWTWTAEVVSNRSRAEARAKEERKTEVQFAKGEGQQGNDFQAPYVSASKVGTPRTMVPRNLEGAMRESLSRIVRRAGGDVDGWVAEEFGYSREDLARLFSPEQVDALATYLYAEERGRGMLNADQMGVGKGRFLAAILRRNALKGFKTIFNTEKQQNLSDIWRDIVHTESDHLIKPFFLNDAVEVIDERTKAVVHTSAPRDEVERIMASGEWPEGTNLVLATYSQFQRKADKAPGGEMTLMDAKSEWLRTVVDRNVRLVMDECHNAASLVSNVSKNVQKAVSQADPSVVYSSATFAKGAEQMAFYAPLFPDGLSSSELTSMMQRGGETFQEVLSAMLVQDGVMVRREFDLSQLTYETILDTPRFERNRAYMDAIAPVLFKLVQLSGEVDRTLRHLNNANDAQAGRPNEAVAALPAPEGDQAEAMGRAPNRRRVRPFHMTRTGHGSPLYTISRLFVAALKVDATVEDAIQSLQENKKPVIFVESTVQSLLDEIAETTDNVDGSMVPDFRALFHRTLRQMTHARWKDANQEQFRRDMTETVPELRAKVDELKAMIDALPPLPVSSIDEVKRRIRETGFTCDEITGRDVEVSNGRIVRRAASNPTVVKNSFNDGDLDAVIINAAGSTGIDLHASVRFKDRRPRRLIELQPPADILRKIQGHGRVNRYDQVERPEIISILSGLPIELRLCAMENAKLRRLSANTTSNRDAAILTRNIPDLINPVGDVVCARYAEARPDLMRRLGFRVEDVLANSNANLNTERLAEDAMRVEIADGAAKAPQAGRDESSRNLDSRRSANEILSRMIMLPVAMQERMCNELTAEFEAAIEELEARGETPLRTHDLPGIVHPRERTVFDGADMENPDSVFHEPLYALEGALEKTGKPIKVDDLMEMIQIGEMASGRAQGCIDQLRSNLEEILEPFLPHGCASVADAMERERATGGGEVTRRKARIEQLAETLGEVKPGKQVSYTLDGVVVKGIVTRVEYPDRGYEAVPSKYGVEFVVPGDERRRSMRLETMMKDPAFKVDDGLEGNDYDRILKDFENTTKVKLSNISILTHNIYRAMRMNVEHRLGKLMTFVLNDGTRHRGVVVSKAHRNLKNAVPVELPDADMAWEALVGVKTDLVGSNTLEDKIFSLRVKGETVEVRLPRKNSRMGFIYDDPIINGLLRLWTPTASKSASPRVTVSKTEARDVLNALYETGAKFWCSPVHRQWATDWQKAHAGEKAADDKPRRGRGRPEAEREDEAPAMAMG